MHIHVYKFSAFNKYVISFCVTASSDNYSIQVFIYFAIIILQFTILMHLHTLDVHLDLGSVISFCVTASSDNYSIQAFETDWRSPGGIDFPPLVVQNNNSFRMGILWR